MRLPLVAGDALLRVAFTREPRLAGILQTGGRLAPARGHIRNPPAGSGRFLFVRPATFGVTAGECGLIWHQFLGPAAPCPVRAGLSIAG